MNLPKSARYALYAAIEMARVEDGGSVTAAEVAERHGIPPAVLAKVLQNLVRAGVAHGARGSGGGYRLARKPSDVTVLEILEIFEPPSSLSDRRGGGAVERLFQEVDGSARATLASVTLGTLAGRPRLAGALRRAGRRRAG